MGASSRVESTQPVKRVHYPALDGLRGVAVLTVMLLHFTMFEPGTLLENGLNQLLHSGWIGVDLFFVLSGFLITGILIDTRDDPHYFRNFYARRTLRIFPLYYLYLLLLFIVLPLVSAEYAAEHAANDRRFWLWTYLGNVLMGSQGWAGMPSHTTHLWSLAIEEQFYLVWPLLVYMVPRRKMLSLCVATIGVAVATRAYLASNDAWAAGYVLTPARVDTLAAGAIIAVVLRQSGADAVQTLSRYFLAAGVALIALGIAWSYMHGGRDLLAALDPGTQTFAYPGLALSFAAVVGWSVTEAPFRPLPRFLTRSGLRTLGKYSYALYLIHVPLRNVLVAVRDRMGGLPEIAGSQLPAQVAVTAVGIAASLGFALLSWNFFEKPILKLKRYFEPGVPPKRPAGKPAPVRAAPRPSTP